MSRRAPRRAIRLMLKLCCFILHALLSGCDRSLTRWNSHELPREPFQRGDRWRHPPRLVRLFKESVLVVKQSRKRNTEESEQHD